MNDIVRYLAKHFFVESNINDFIVVIIVTISINAFIITTLTVIDISNDINTVMALLILRYC